MKMKRLVSLLLALSLCFALVACGAKNEASGTTETTPTLTTEPTVTEPAVTVPTVQEVGNATPLLYRVTDGDGNVLWLFGSIHVGREDYYPLPSYVTDAFDGADALAVELDIIAFEKDLGQQMQALSVLVYRDGTTIKDHIPEELYIKAVDALTELGGYITALDMYYPAFWFSMVDSLMIEKLGARIDLGIDRHLLERAKNAGKEIRDIESAQAQYAMMAGFSDELQALLLKEALRILEEPELAKQDLETLMDLWASGDEAAFAAYLAGQEEEVTPEEEKLYEEYNKAMITDRNLLMTDYAEAALLSGEEVFICVGAAHVVGEGAMAQLLAQRGYTVELVTQ